MTTANWRSRSSSATVLPGAKACVSASVLPTATTTRRPDIRKPSTAASRAAMRWRTLRSSSWSTARQPSHSSAAASGSTISTINVRSVTWKGMERRDPFISPRASTVERAYSFLAVHLQPRFFSLTLRVGGVAARSAT